MTKKKLHNNFNIAGGIGIMAVLCLASYKTYLEGQIETLLSDVETLSSEIETTITQSNQMLQACSGESCTSIDVDEWEQRLKDARRKSIDAQSKNKAAQNTAERASYISSLSFKLCFFTFLAGLGGIVTAIGSQRDEKKAKEENAPKPGQPS